ncbi:MAG: MASE1 domain-containing protein, partial [Burkholderiaceae bacterium]|nr:MASE1 domain-containing protein [Burkholderiaceae bacterium]
MTGSMQVLLQQTRTRPSVLQWAKRALLVLLASVMTGKAGLMISFVTPEISLIWLPAGIGVAALLRWGESMFIPVFISALLLSLDSNLNWGVGAFIAFSNALGSMVCFWILRNRQFYQSVMQLRDVFWLCIAAFIAMTIPATLGTTALTHEGLSFEPQLTWLCWWAGDTVGVLLATPLILAFSLNNFRQLRGRVNEFVLFLTLFGLLHWLIFFSSYHSLHLIFLTMAAMIWAALRFNMSVVPLIVLISSVCAIWATYNATGPFSATEIQENMFVLWLYIATISVSAMFITALQTERHMANEKLRESYERIHKVASRLPGVIMQVRVTRDGAMTIPFASDGLFTLFGVKELAVRSDAQQLFSAIEPEDKEKCLHALREAQATTGIWQSEIRRLNTLGNERWLYIDGMPETEADGALLWHCFISDITNRKAIEHDLRIAATTFESQEGMFV